ncbi:hypothetical protein AYJ59_07600 [Thiomicrospira sp. S5]|nr:hypothetical protein AYJ59_07600 [Thiomicrospira sp. S5]
MPRLLFCKVISIAQPLTDKQPHEKSTRPGQIDWLKLRHDRQTENKAFSKFHSLSPAILSDELHFLMFLIRKFR